MPTIFGVVFVKCKQVVVESHKRVPNIINFHYKDTTTLDSKALVIRGCSENTYYCFHATSFRFVDCN